MIARRITPAVLAWAAGLTAAYAWRHAAGAEFLAPVRRALAGPYDPSTFASVMSGHAGAAIAAGTVMAAAAGWGVPAAVWLRIRGAGAGLAGTGLGLVALGTAVWGAGLAGLLFHPVLAGLALVAIPGWRARGRTWFAAMSRARPRDGIGWLLGAAVALPCGLYLGAALAPELGWDALTYHLHAPGRYLARGRISVIPYSLGTFYPFLAEMWLMLGLAWGGETAAKLVNFLFLPLVGASLLGLGVRVGRPRAGWIAALFFAATPAAGMLSVQSYNDLETAALGLLAVSAFARGGAGWNSAGFLLAGGMAACKFSGAWAVPVAAAAWVWHARSAVPARSAGKVPRERRAGRAFDLAPAALLASLVAAAWPLRTWLLTGNPFYPLAAGWFPSGGWNPYFTAEQAAAISPVSGGEAGAIAAALARFPFDFVTSIHAVGMPFSAALLAWLPGLVLPGAPVRRLVLPLAAGAACAGLWVLSGAGDGRYLLPVAALWALPAAVGACRIAEGPAWRAAVVAALVAVQVSVQAAVWTAYVSRAYVPWRVAAGLEPRTTYLARALLPNHAYVYMADRINRELPRDGRVLLLAGLHGFFIDREVIFDTQQVMPPVALRLSRGCGTPSVLRRRFRRLGIRYVLHTPQLEAFERECRCLASREPDGNCLGEFWRRYAEPMFSVGELTLYRLRGEAEAAARPPPVRLAWPAVEEVAFVEADTLHLAGDLRGAERALAALARRDPALTSVRLRLASLYQATGRWEEAERHLERARRSGEDRAAYWLLLARALARRDEREGAYEAARRGVERWPSPRAYVSLAVHALNTGRVREAEEAAERARLLDPADRGVRRIVARLL